MVEFARVARYIVRGTTAVSIAVVASACSGNVDILDPDTWNGPSPSEQSTAATPATVDDAGGQGKTVAEASDQYPAVADIPAKPATTSDDEQKQVANALVADRTQAQYSAEALQAGNEPAAAPPPPAEAEAALPADAAPPPSTPGTLPSEAPAAAPTAPVATATPPPPPSVATAAPTASAPAARVSAAPAVPTMTDDAALGFQPSRAPALDPYVAQVAGGSAPRGQRLASMTAAPNAVSGPPAATVTFAANSMVLDANAAAQVQAAIAAYRTQGGQGYVRVVGHSASGAANLPADRQMIQSLERAQACANAVAREIIRQGVPANRVLVDATGSLAQDEQRRAEIFLQG